MRGVEREISEKLSQDPRVMSLLLFEPRLCTLHELQTIYSLKDFYDFIEIVDVQTELKEEARKQRELNQNK